MYDASGTNEHLQYREYVPPNWPRNGGNPEKHEDFDRKKAAKFRTNMMVPLLHNGVPLDFRSMLPQQIRDNTEMMTPLVRPYGCGPVAPADWLVLRTYQRIVEMRDEMRMDEDGLCIGDRTFKRRYQQAQPGCRPPWRWGGPHIDGGLGTARHHDIREAEPRCPVEGRGRRPQGFRCLCAQTGPG